MYVRMFNNTLFVCLRSVHIVYLIYLFKFLRYLIIFVRTCLIILYCMLT